MTRDYLGEENGIRGIYDLQAIFLGILTGIGILFMWYQVYGPQGLTGASAATILIPTLGFSVHHEIYGVSLVTLGLAVAVGGIGARSPFYRYLGFMAVGIGTVLFIDDFLFHCVTVNIVNGQFQGVSCQNWP